MVRGGRLRGGGVRGAGRGAVLGGRAPPRGGAAPAGRGPAVHVRALGPVSKGMAGLRRAQTTAGGVAVPSGYNTGIPTKRRLARPPLGLRLGSAPLLKQDLAGCPGRA